MSVGLFKQAYVVFCGVLYRGEDRATRFATQRKEDSQERVVCGEENKEKRVKCCCLRNN